MELGLEFMDDPVALLERIEPDGGVRFSSDLYQMTPPVMVVGDRVVTADDAVYDANDGGLVERAAPPAWDTLSWVNDIIMCRYLGSFSKGT